VGCIALEQGQTKSHARRRPTPALGYVRVSNAESDQDAQIQGRLERAPAVYDPLMSRLSEIGM
jgi:hypothetical protein